VFHQLDYYQEDYRRQTEPVKGKGERLYELQAEFRYRKSERSQKLLKQQNRYQIARSGTF